LLVLSRRLPGHFFEATAARVLAQLGRTTDASVELERLLPRVLAGSGPRWLGAMADLSVAAAATGNEAAAAALYDALLPYQGRLADAIAHLDRALAWEEETGALPGLVRTLAARAAVFTARSGEGDVDRA